MAKISQKEIKNIVKSAIQEAFNEMENKKYLCEGIDLKYDKRGRGYVSYNPDHERLVNTSTEYNPTVRTDIIPGVVNS